jgi:uncharacterized protein YjbI with pentapeptide repeats
MKASEVLSRYAAGERDFRRANLRGQSFKGQDLSGADFSEADIRGTNFAQAQLQGTNFTQVTAGVQRRWLVGQLMLALFLSILLNFASVLLNVACLAYFFTPSTIQEFTVIPGITFLVFIEVVFFAIARQGFTPKGVSTIAIAIAVTYAIAVVVVVAHAGIYADAIVGVGVVVVAFAGAVVVASAVVITADVVDATVDVCAVAVTLVVAVAVVDVYAIADTAAVVIAGAIASAIAVASLLLGIYCNRRAFKGDEKFALLRSFGIAFAALGGTRFNQADLTGANFTHATLKSTNFRAATLTHVCWHTAQKLDRARVGDSILANAAILDLLTSRNGYKKSYIDANLRGANLEGVNLSAANLKWADLREATLKQASLHNTNLREVQAIGTDFTQAYLTGACLESWNIDHTTKLDQVDCQYVFLLEHLNELGSRERRPHSPDEVFKPGDFEKLYRKMINVVQVLFRNGMNSTAFAAAFQELMEENPDISPDSIRAIERKGNDALVTLEVSETANKAKFPAVCKPLMLTKCAS